MLVELVRSLRALPLPMIGSVVSDKVLLDLRCLEDDAAFSVQLPALRRALEPE
jgi:L-seryl-tRNA(Ser) seleniumtransferase